MEFEPGRRGLARWSSARETGAGGPWGKVSSLLTVKPDDDQIVTPWVSVAEALRRLNAPPKGSALVVVGETGRIIGTVSEQDIVAGLAEHGIELLGMAAENVMSQSVAVCSPRNDLATAMRVMTASRCHHLLVLDHGELVGIISMVNLVHARLVEAELEAAALRVVMATQE